MKVTSNRISLLLALCVGCSAQGAYVTVSTTELSRPAVTSNMWVRDSKLRADSGDNFVMYDGAQLVGGDTVTKTYTVVDRKTLDNTAKQMSELKLHAQKKIEYSLRDVPEDEKPRAREMAEHLVEVALQSIDQLALRPKLTVEATTATDHVEGIACTIWKVTLKAAKVQDICVARTSSVVGGAMISESSKSLIGMFGDLAGLAGELAAYRSFRDIDGVPVRVRDYRGETVYRESVMRSSVLKSVPSGSFEIPPGYRLREQSLPSRPQAQ